MTFHPFGMNWGILITPAGWFRSTKASCGCCSWQMRKPYWRAGSCRSWTSHTPRGDIAAGNYLQHCLERQSFVDSVEFRVRLLYSANSDSISVEWYQVIRSAGLAFSAWLWHNSADGKWNESRQTRMSECIANVMDMCSIMQSCFHTSKCIRLRPWPVQNA